MLITRTIVLASCLAFVGCTTLRPVPEISGVPRVVVGDLVRVKLENGNEMELTVVESHADGIVGEPTSGDGEGSTVQVRFSEIANIERRERSRLKTFMLVAAVVLGLAYVWTALEGPSYSVP